jgi:prolyl-tRNA editing enzyme YbaK/EbsC (Cys-tRNA(Pro) deacylase)
MVFEKILQLLNEAHIEYKLSEHSAVTTSEEAARIRGVELRTGAKAMVAKSKENFVLLVLPADRKINWRAAKSELGVKELSLAATEEAEAKTGCKRGSVPPFGNVLGIEVFMDRKILENEWINFNPGSLVHSIQMRSEDLVRLVNPTMVSIIDGDTMVSS